MAGTVLLAVCWIASGLLTAVMVLLLAQPLAIPECVSFDASGQRVAQVVAALTVAAMAGVWVVAVNRLRSGRLTTNRGRAVLAVGLPVVLVLTFLGGGGLMTAAVDRVADSSDHAMCW